MQITMRCSQCLRKLVHQTAKPIGIIRGGAQEHQRAIDANGAVQPASDDPFIANTVADT